MFEDFNDENSNAHLANQVVKSKASSKGRTVEQIYQKKTQLEHILLRPDTYVGSVEKVTQPMWVLDRHSQRIVLKTITYVPGLFKIFDEIIVNAADNKQRDPSMDRIEVTIDQENNTISVWNNGHGIPVVIHKDQNMYVPEMIFGHLLTGSNFDDDEKKTTGGRNGYGAKLANIFSKEFIIETSDQSNGKRFKQTFRNNMSERDSPIITSASGPEYTCVTFKPDLTRFKMDRLDDDIVSLFCKRAYDVAGGNVSFSGKRLRVVLNGNRLPVNTFQQYLELYDGVSAPVVFQKVNDRWEVGVGISDGQMQQISFVNSICTSKGGQHVTYIADQIVQKLSGIVKRKNKNEEVKPHIIKNHLSIFVNCLIENPAFDSQTKETLTTRSAAFGSTCALPEGFLKQIEKSSVIDSILSYAKFKQNEQLKRKGGKKQVRLIGIPKLDDANFAGSARGHECTLVLTEGDSAKSLAVSGLSVVGRDFYGVFPLKGKPLNVREAQHAQMMKNDEVQNIVKILGLKFGVEYTDVKSLRYGHLMIMTDQDHDGSHIKGLLINLFHFFFPSLLQINGFLQQFITPIVKCTKGKNSKVFYTIPEYQSWKAEHNDGKGWTIKYYKGLGTSTSQEAKEYFSDLPTHKLNFAWQDAAIDGELIDMAFAKKRVDDRKEWLRGFVPGTHVDYKVKSMTYENFINKELILFSLADNMRSIPHIFDGFKPSQRKVLFSCFKRKLKNEIKVAQLAGYISEHSAYHHGEMSLNSTIINMAQNFIGTNNINLLYPSGQFGTRLMGGKDAASPRYIFTRLETIARLIFHPDDDALLNFLDDDGQSIEPDYYLPVIPMILVNGSDGIGTGWSSTIPTYNPREIINNLRRKIKEEEMEDMHPWYRGYTGEIRPSGKGNGSFTVVGKVDIVDATTLFISELPVHKWTQDYKAFLETLLPGAAEGTPNGTIKAFTENHTDTTVAFTVTLEENVLNQIRIEPGGLVKKFKLETSISTSNMHAFNESALIERFTSPLEIIDVFYTRRSQGYVDRKEYMVNKLNREFRKLDNKVRFILAVVEGRLIVNNRKKKELLNELLRENYELFDGKDEDKGKTDDEEVADEFEDEEVDVSRLARGYDYLLSMKIWSLTMEMVIKLRAEREAKHLELRELEATPSWQLWLNDLDSIEAALDEIDREREAAESNVPRPKGGKSRSKAPATKPKPTKSKKMEENADDISDFDDSGSDSDFGYNAKMQTKKNSARNQVGDADFGRAKTNGKSDPTPMLLTGASSKASAVSKPKKTEKVPLPSKQQDIKQAFAMKTVPVNVQEMAVPVEKEPISLAERMRMRMGGSNIPLVSATSEAPSVFNESESDDDVFNCRKNLAEVQISHATKNVAINLHGSAQDAQNDVEMSTQNTVGESAPLEVDSYTEEFDFQASDSEEFKTTKPKQKTEKVPKQSKPRAPKVPKVPKPVGQKRAKKDAKAKQDLDTVEIAKDNIMFSPGSKSPEQTKKRRTAPAGGKKKPMVLDSSEESDVALDVEEAPINKTPKPTRQRSKPVTYVIDSTEEENSFAEENEDSDFEF